MFAVYRFTLPNEKFYIGVTNNLNTRINTHYNDVTIKDKYQSIVECNLTLSEFSKCFEILYMGKKAMAYYQELSLINIYSESEMILNKKIPNSIPNYDDFLVWWEQKERNSINNKSRKTREITKAKKIKVEKPKIQPLMTYDGVSEYLNLDKNEVIKLVKNGEIKHVKIGSSVRINKNMVDNYIEKCTTLSTTEVNGDVSPQELATYILEK